MHYLSLLALAACSALFASCGAGIRVYELPDSLPGQSHDDAVHGVLFHRRVDATKTTKWLDEEGIVLFEIEEPTTMVDRNRTFVVEGFNDSWNPFNTLEFTAKLGDDDTLSEVAYKADPQLSSALKSAGDAKGSGLYGGVDDAMAPPQSVSDLTKRIEVVVEAP